MNLARYQRAITRRGGISSGSMTSKRTIAGMEVALVAAMQESYVQYGISSDQGHGFLEYACLIVAAPQIAPEGAGTFHGTFAAAPQLQGM